MILTSLTPAVMSCLLAGGGAAGATLPEGAATVEEPTGELRYAALAEEGGPSIERTFERLPVPQEGTSWRRDGRAGWYAQIAVGLTSTDSQGGPETDIDFDDGWSLPVAVGYRFPQVEDRALAWEAELEVYYSDQDADDGGFIAFQGIRDVNLFGPMINGIADYSFNERFGVYGGLGIGMMWVDVGTDSDFDFEEDDGPYLAWQVKAGLRGWFNEDLSWHFGYRFLNADDAEIDGETDDVDIDLETQQHSLEVGLRFLL